MEGDRVKTTAAHINAPKCANRSLKNHECGLYIFRDRLPQRLLRPCVLHMSSYKFFLCIRSSFAFHWPSGTSIRLRFNWALWLNSKFKFPM